MVPDGRKKKSMTIFALEQAVSNGCQLDITEADSALEEVAALRDEHERLKNDAAIFYEAAAGLLATNDALRAQLAEAQKDSERLDWIGNQTCAGVNLRGNVWMVGWKDHAMRGLDFRSAIDTARESK
jgi:hypothetical protein